ncbi:MAG: hypothetical protein D6705_04395 [Deltaproteobacteria bacterium]|nr:MAG: hypothetical protein D6705_04395 [Deltaproteobacteria bacterium]
MADWDFGRLFARRAAGVRLGLDAVRGAHRALGAPCADRPALRVVGTNGKGSCVFALSEALRAAGRRVGAYTSPHLSSVEERVRIDGLSVERDVLGAACEAVLTVADDPRLSRPLSFFEVLTLAALRIFEDADVDVVVLEAGLGGRLDATGVVEAAALGVTRIGLDHQDVLGPDLASIAREKAGAMAPGQAVVSVPQVPPVRRVLSDHARSVGARLRFMADDEIRAAAGRWPDHLAPARALAVALGRVLVPELSASHLPASPPFGRGTVVPFGRGTILLDVAHNEDALRACGALVAARAPGGRADLVVFGCIGTRDPAALVAPLASRARHVRFVDLGPEGAPLPEGACALSGPAEAAAWVGRMAARGGTCVVAGSFRLVGPVANLLGVAETTLARPDPQDPTGRPPAA